MNNFSSLWKILLLLASAAIITGCGGGGAPAAPLPLDTSPAPSTSGSELTISGSVSNMDGVVLEISATIGGKTYVTSSDADGTYELLIDSVSDGADDLVILSAQGYGDESLMEYRSVLGHYQSIVAAAGSDDKLTSAEMFSVNITNLTTAAYGMALIQNGNQIPSTEATIRKLDVQVKAEELLMASAAIKLAVEQMQAGTGSLMADDMSTLELATSTVALNSFITAAEQMDSGLITNAKIDSLNDSLAVKQQREMTEDILFIYEPGIYPSAYELYDDGAGREHIGAETRDFDWTANGNEILFDYADLVVSSETTFDDDGSEYLNQIVLVEGLLTFVSARDGYEIVNIKNAYVSRVLDALDPSLPPIKPDEPIDWDQTSGAGRGAKAFHTSNGQVFSAPVTTENWILPVARRLTRTDNPLYINDVSVDFLTISDSFTGVGSVIGSFNWQVNPDGHLAITTDSGSIIEYIPFADFIWGAIERDVSGKVTGLTIAQGGKREASAVNLTPGYYTLDWSWMDDYNSRFWIEINQDGSSTSVTTYDNDNDGVINALYGEAKIKTGNWTINGDRMIVNFYFDDDYQPCQSELVEGCNLYNRRFWDMIAVDGDRYYMAHTHNFFDYLNNEQTRYYLNSRYWVKLDDAPIEVITGDDSSVGDINEIGFAALEASYNRLPLDNAWHDVWVGSEDDNWYWFNAAGQRWLMYEENGKLMVDSAYGTQEIQIKLDEQGQLLGLFFNRETYFIVDQFEGPEGSIDELGFSALKANYERKPVDSASYDVWIDKDGDDWYWYNAAGSAWLLYAQNGKLLIDFGWTTRSVAIELNQQGSVRALWADGEAYERVE